MLGKLIKYELKATSRTFLPVYGAIILVALVNNLFRLGNIEMGFGLTVVLLVGLFVALGVLTIVVVIKQFNRNLLGDEGYLMFTLPTKTSNLIASKLIVTIIWAILSSIVAFLTFIILIIGTQQFREIYTELPRIWAEFIYMVQNQEGIDLTLFIVSMPLFILLGYIQSILTIYLSLATAQLPVFSKHRGIISFVAFFVISTGLQFIVGIATMCFPEAESMLLAGNIILPMIVTLVINVLFFLGIHFILDKHLNLE